MKNLVIGLILFCVLNIQATIINIPVDQPTIQTGIEVAVNGDTVLVQPGTYFENINYNGKNIIVASLFYTTQDSIYIAQTIIDGNEDGSVVTFENFENNTALLSGFTLTNGKGILSNSDITGGGITCSNSSNTENLYPRIENLYIVMNESDYGGGIFCDKSAPHLKNVTIMNNIADLGGGILCLSSNPILENVIIADNATETSGNSFSLGGGIACYENSNPIFANVTVKNNIAKRGGGIYCSDSNLSFSSENRSSIYSNEVYEARGLGRDIFSKDCSTINVIVDTFTVLNPSDYYATPIDNYTFDVINSIESDLIDSDLYVAINGDNSNLGTSPEEPLQTITYALTVIYSDSCNINTIHLAPGVYGPTSNGESLPLIWNNYVNLSGASETESIIDANNLASVFKLRNITEAIIENITITGGYSSSGAGISCIYGSSPKIKNVTLINNTATSGGGAIVCAYDSNPILQEVTLKNNSAKNGGAIYCYDNSSPTLKRVSITNNSAIGYNSSGGGIYCFDHSNPNFENVTVANNTAEVKGGGLYCDYSTNTSLMNSIFWNNSPQSIYIDSIGENVISISYSDIQGGEQGIVSISPISVDWLTGNLDQDPLFADALNGEFHLTEFSPCIDSGDPSSPLDSDGTIADMGALYFDQSTDIEDNDIQAAIYSLSNYPNPFNPATIISFTLANISNVDLVIYNIKGQNVRTLLSENLERGNHSVVWNGIDANGKFVSSGVYYYKLYINGKTESINKCLLLK